VAPRYWIPLLIAFSLFGCVNPHVKIDRLSSVSPSQPWQIESAAVETNQIYYAEAYVKELEGNYAEALELYNKALSLDPQNLETRLKIAYINMLRLDLETSASMAEQIIEIYPDSAQAHLIRALSYENLSKMDEALESYSKYLDLSPDDIKIGHKMAQMFYDKDDIDKAVKYGLQVWENGGRTRDVALLLGNSYVKNEDFTSAEKFYEHALDLDPEYYKTHFNLGLILEEAGNFEEALKLYGKAEELCDNPRILVSIQERFAHVLFETNNYEKAFPFYQKLSAIKNDKYIYPFQAGRCQLNLHNYSQALEWFLKAYGRETDKSRRDYRLYRYMGTTHSLLGNYQDAIDFLKRAHNIYPKDIETVLQLANSYNSMGEPDEAIRIINKVLDSIGENFLVYYWLGWFYEQDGRYPEAAEALQKALSLEPEDSETIILLAAVYYKLEKHKPADELFKKYEKIDPKNSNTFFRLGGTYYELKVNDKAENYFRKSIELDPENASALNHLGYLLAEQGIKLDEGISLVNKALEILPDTPEFLDSLGWLYYMKGDYPKALKYLLKADKLMKNTDPIVKDHIGDTYEKLKNMENALKYWTEALNSSADNENEIRLKIRELAPE
jgi:tetratricopeptide (TPR) repeat protein